MSEGNADFVKRRHTKNCRVVLQRLDEESLDNCLQKYGLKLASQNGHTKPPIRCKTHSKADAPVKRKRRKRKHSDVFVRRSENFKRKKIKSLSYTDDKNSSEDENSRVKGEAATCDRVGPQVFSNLEDNNTSLREPDTTASLTSESEEVICQEISTTEKISPANKNGAEGKSEVRGKTESIPKHHLGDSLHSRSKNCGVSGESDGELEIIQELPKRSNVCGKTNPDERKSTKMSPKGQLAANSESLQDLEEDEYDSREDGEDDKDTVIFEEEFQKDSDLDEIYEIEEKGVVSKIFNNREITNRKRQRLVKFKRKSMSGRNLATFIRPKIKLAEGVNNEQETREKPIESISEECLKEVCGLVERLHDMHRIILQLKKELPKNAELAVHFTRVINVQQESFHKEIRRSQKTIIKCYEKMLSVYRDTSKVARVIGRRTSMRVEDIVDVISRCILIEGQCETDETTIGNQEKVLDSKKIGENATRSAKIKTSQSECLPKQQAITSCISFPPYIATNPLHINNRPKLVHRSDKLHTAWEPPEKEKTLDLSASHVKASLQDHADNQITRKYKTQARVQQNPSESTTNPVNTASEDARGVLDPTVPQKLTMRNCRLQAGPVLGEEDEGVKNSNAPQLSKEKMCAEYGNSDRKDLKPRVYVCAQNDCKSPGVRICRGCRSVIYCSRFCQLKHWTLKHKSECYQLRALRE